MNKSKVLFLVLVGGILSGCATPSSITLNDGREIQTRDTPVYEKASGFYEFKQLDGKLTRVNKDQVRTIKDL